MLAVSHAAPAADGGAVPAAATHAAIAGPDAAGLCRIAGERGTRRSDAHEDLDALLWMQRSAEYQANTRSVYRGAATQLVRLLQERRAGRFTPALLDPFTPLAGPREPVVIMDLDESVLDNSLLQGRLLRDARSWDQAIWECWIASRQATL
ncbi:MAG: hypothetical protein QM771_20490, partial [Nitrospira sp.]